MVGTSLRDGEEDGFSGGDAAREVGEVVAWTIAEAVAESVGAAAAIKILQLLKDIDSGIENEFNAVAPHNPRFVQNGHSGASPVTIKYLKGRAGKQIAGSAIAFTGSMSSQVTQVDVAGLLQHGNAVGSTAAHMKMFGEIAQLYPRSNTVQAWINTCLIAKRAKLAVRSTGLAGAAIPIGAVGISTTIASAIAKAGVRLRYGTVISRCAMELHWRAKVELALAGVAKAPPDKANGPASAVLFELFRRRGFTKMFGQYEVAKIINEPGGWVAVKDKLLLI